MQIEIRDASISFGPRVVFEGFNADFRASRITALVGPSGSGKSTLLSVIAGYRALDRGEIRVAGGQQNLPSPEYVAWVPQGLNSLSARTVLDNVMMGALASGRTVDEARTIAIRWLEMVGIDHIKKHQARELSGGELQRLALARALASDRPIILADEPSANLDRKNTENVADLLGSVTAEALIVVATHDPLLVARVDDVVEMRPGE
jgi:putative ABC transport system ATP-binding protein